MRNTLSVKKKILSARFAVLMLKEMVILITVLTVFGVKMLILKFPATVLVLVTD